MANLSGASTFSDGGFSSQTSDIVSNQDLILTTTPDHNVFLNFNKSNTSNDGSGDLIINAECVNVNTQIKTGDLNVNVGDINVTEGNLNLTTGQIMTPSFQTSQTSFAPATTVTTLTTLSYTVGSFLSTSSGTSGTQYHKQQLNSSAASLYGFVAKITVPADTSYLWTITTYPQFTITDFHDSATISCYLTFAPDGEDNPINTNTACSTTLAKIFSSPVGSTTYTDASLFVYENSSAYGVHVNTYVTGYANQVVTQNFAPYIFTCILPPSATALDYSLVLGENLAITYKGSATGNIYNILFNKAALSTSTVAVISNIFPSNNTIGLTYCDQLSYKALLPRYATSWMFVSTGSTYVITHNLNMQLSTPLAFRILYTAVAGVYPITDVTQQFYYSTAASAVGSYWMEYIDANTMQFWTAPTSVCWLGGSTSGNETTGFWNILIY